MGRGRPRKEKNEFPMLDDDTKNEIAGKSREELSAYLARVSMDQENLMTAKKNDGDLKECQEKLGMAMAIYRDGTKRNRQRIQYAMRCLGDKGGDTQPDGEATKVA